MAIIVLAVTPRRVAFQHRVDLLFHELLICTSIKLMSRPLGGRLQPDGLCRRDRLEVGPSWLSFVVEAVLPVRDPRHRPADGTGGLAAGHRDSAGSADDEVQCDGTVRGTVPDDRCHPRILARTHSSAPGRPVRASRGLNLRVRSVGHGWIFAASIADFTVENVPSTHPPEFATTNTSPSAQTRIPSGVPKTDPSALHSPMATLPIILAVRVR